MADSLRSLASKVPWISLARRTGLPLPLPQELVRNQGRWRADELHGLRCRVLGDGPAASAWRASLTVLGATPATGPCDAVILDVTTLQRAGQLDGLLELAQSAVVDVVPNGRVVVAFRRPRSSLTVDDDVVPAALHAFVRSLGKELGRKGITVNGVSVEDGAHDAAWPAVAFLVSRRASFISGEVLPVAAPMGTGSATAWAGALQGKTAVVTGAGQGIGLAIVERLGTEGVRVLGVDRAGGPLNATMGRVGAQALELDVTEGNAPQRIRDAAGPIHLLVHNAGITRDRTFRKMEAASWRSVLEVNLHAPARISQALLDNGLADDGRIVLMSSVSGISGNAGQTNYAASKGGLLGLTRALSLAGSLRGITVNAVAPGFIETPMTAHMPFAVREVARRFNALMQGGEPADVAEAVTFLARPECGGISGAVLRVCGLNFVGR